MKRASMLRSLVPGALAALSLLVACSSDELTEIVVVIDTDMAVPADLDGVRLVVESPAGTRETMTSLGGAADPQLPLSFSLSHGDHSWLGPVTVTAQGTLAGTLVVEQRRRTSFLRGERRLLRLFLSSACVGVGCMAEETCVDGACTTIDVPPETLPRWQGEVPPRFDGGLVDGSVDGGMPDGDVDGGGGCPTGTTTCDGVCTNVTSDLSNCGACGTVCGSSHATPSCLGGTCMLACDPGFSDCNGDAADGCETYLGDAASCGACAMACSSPTGLCSFDGTASSCVDACPTTAPSMCGSSCVDTSLDLAHCGACDAGCDPDHGTGQCAGGACTLTACDPGFADCNGEPGDGCEADLSDPTNCGGCGVTCALDHTMSVCELGMCVIVGCDGGWGDCDGDPTTGCEQALTSTAHCGACGSTCSLPNAMVACDVGTCDIAGCVDGWADCNGMASDGCEADLTSAASCGACGNVCPAATEPFCGRVGDVYACRAACDMGLATCGTTCADTQTSLEHCGGCGMRCAPPNATAMCSAGRCSIASCDPGWGDCNGMVADGCESRLDSTAHCGACGSACAYPNAVESCASGACMFISCEPGYGNCDGSIINGCERALSTLTDCGVCDRACSIPNATESCATGTCTLVSCDAGTRDCDGNPLNGCEDVASDPANCGMCGNVCRGRPNASGSCSGGACAFTCNPTFADCDTSPGNGCECGAPAGAMATCAGRDCAWTCQAGFTNCNGLDGDGCEVATGTDPNNCGACGNVCPTRAQSTRTCTGGSCGFTCNAGYADCNGVATDGCEVPLATTVAHCGACGNACPDLPNSSPTCAGSACGFRCDPGFADCNGLASDGCEIDTRTNVNHCGMCGVICASRPNTTRACATGSCAYTCNAPFQDCNGLGGDGCEANTAISVTDCGTCGNACPSRPNSTRTCSAGACGYACNPPYLDCNGSALDGCEVDGSSSLLHCGMCGRSCATRPNTATTCTSGTCSYMCNAGYTDCNTMTSDGCETATGSDVNNCGACGNVCPTRAGDTATCTGGVCGFACLTGFRDCNGSTLDGCETSITDNLMHCGACGNACVPRANASIYCAGGMCGFTCNAGYRDCNTMPGDGCETSTTTLTNCGGCGIVCDYAHASESCATGSCVFGMCDAGWQNCNGITSDGCEINTLTDRMNCGMCGNRCPGGTSCSSGTCV